jgi:hypothetical protein
MDRVRLEKRRLVIGMSMAMCSEAIYPARFGKECGKLSQLGFELVENRLRAIQMGSLPHAQSSCARA